MAKRIPLLTPSQVQNAKPKATPYKLRDPGGLFLLVNSDGSKWWRHDYRRPITGMRNTLALGTFPEVSLVFVLRGVASAGREAQCEQHRSSAWVTCRNRTQ